MAEAVANGLVTRRLPVEEYSRLEGTEFGETWRLLPPEAIVLVVEADGRIVACWSLLQIWHLEGLWMAEDVRKSPAVGRRLLGSMRQQVKSIGVQTVLTAARDSDELVPQLLQTIGAERVPVQLYSLRME